MTTVAAFAELPPLIDRDAFFGEVKIAGAQISPDGKYVSFLKPYQDTRNIWVKKVDEPFSAARPVSAETKRPVPGYFWSRDSRYILYSQDQAGDENFNIYAVDPAAPADAATGAPPARNISNAKGSRALIYSLPRTEPDILYMGLNDRDKAWHDLYKLRISTGERALVRKNTDRVAAWIFDNAGTLRLAMRTDDHGSTEILRVDPDKFALLYSCDVFENCGPLRFDHANQTLYLSTNKGADVDLSELVSLDPAGGKVTKIESDPKKRVDLENAMFSDVDDRLLATIYTDEKTRIYWKDKSYEADYQWLETKLPGREFHFVSHTADERIWIVNAVSDVEPGETFVFDRKTRKLTPQYKVREDVPRAALAEMKAIRYPSSDGLEIAAYLTLPKGLPAKDLPLIVFPHGGPWARDEWGYATFPQFLANRGYAVLQPNFRGSTGYGKKFLNAGNGEWGRKMQDDLTWGVKYLVKEGTVNEKRVGIAGGSYGGYATLAGVAFTPDVYGAAVAIVPPSDLVFLLHSIPAYWEAGRKIMYSRMADPDTAEGKKLLEEESPVNAANRIKTPLMVVQGANDPRVNQRNSDEIVIAARDHDVPVEYLVAPDEGHGFQRPINNLAMVAAMERFLGRHLDARFQETMPENVSTRLKEITVNPKTVALAAPVDASKVGLPAVKWPLTVGTAHYKANLDAGGQTMALETTTEIADGGAGWTVTDKVNTPMGTMTDEAVLDKATLAPKKTHAEQGPMTKDLEFSATKIVGTATTNGQTKPISIDITAPVFADGAGSMDVVAALPLAEGYETTFYNIDPQKLTARIVSLKVTGSETVTVAAGTFDTYKVELMQGEGGGRLTVWVAKDKHIPVKYAASMPSMGGATITGERQ